MYIFFCYNDDLFIFLRGGAVLFLKCHATATAWMKHCLSSSWAYWFHLLVELVVVTCQSSASRAEEVIL